MTDQSQYNRSLHDRRSGFDRRMESVSCTEEKRMSPERRSLAGERRTDWIRETQWSSVYVELLR